MSSVPPPPEDPEDLLAWADEHQVRERLDDLLIGTGGAPGTCLPGRPDERLTYRQILLHPKATGRQDDARETGRSFLHRIATLAAGQRERRTFLQQQGREPDDEVLAAWLDQLRSARREVREAARPAGTYEPLDVTVMREPVPFVRYRERTLIGSRDGTGEELGLLLLGWNEGPLRWALWRGERALPAELAEEPRASLRFNALTAIIDHVLDPRAAADHETLIELLRVPTWQHALGVLDERLSQIQPGSGVGTSAEERVAFVVKPMGDGAFDIEPLIQKRARTGGFSKGARLPWFRLRDRRDLSPAEQRALQAYDDRFTRRTAPAGSWSGALLPAQAFGVLRALIDHPAVLLDDDGTTTRLDLRVGRLRLRFVAADDETKGSARDAGALAARFELLGVTLLASDVARAMRDGQHMIVLHHPNVGAPQLLLAEVSPQAAALVQALAVAPTRFPPEAHDALAVRLEALQETVDIEFPSRWTRSITAAEPRLVVRLERLDSGALQVRLAVRPVKLGPVFAPGEGPALVLEGQGRDRHGVRRDLAAERQSAHAWADRLLLSSDENLEPWCWRKEAGDAALDLVATLQERKDELTVEWADDDRLISHGSVGRGDLRMKVADRKDWFAVEGGVTVAGEQVPLPMLLAAIRDDRRYVPVGARGFVRIEQQLREALIRAEAGLFEVGTGMQLPTVSTDLLIGLVEQEDQIEASASFVDLRRRLRESSEPPPLSSKWEGVLRPYQQAGARWLLRLAHWGAGAVLADEMGLGKTVQTLAVLAHRASIGPALVVAPTSLMANWADEAARFAPDLNVRLLHGSRRESELRALGPGDLVITSYAIAVRDVETLARERFGTLVLDEAQAVKNATTDRSRALRQLDARWRLALTGTPVENHLGELWSIFRVISPGLLGSWEQFRARYAVPIEKFGDDHRRKGLAALLRPFVLRRTKLEVAPELPPRTEIVRTVRLSPEEQGLYEQLRQATLDELAEAKRNPDRDAGDLRFVLLSALTRLRQLCCHPRLVYPHAHASSSKASYLLELLGELQKEGHKALVFSQFRSFLELLAPRLRQHGLRVLVLDGTTPAELRAQRVAAFQAGEADVFLISMKAGGFGLNLTAADYVILLDPWWNPAVEDQATARAHRIGQDKPVTAVRLVARDTVEQGVLSLHAAKRALAAGLLEGTDLAASLETDELLQLIRAGA